MVSLHRVADIRTSKSSRDRSLSTQPCRSLPRKAAVSQGEAFIIKSDCIASGEGQRICGYSLLEPEAIRATIQTMASVRKPVIVRKFSRDWCAGYARPNFGQDAAALEILDLGGKVLSMGWETVKWVCYVRDFPASSADQANPERLLHKRFAVRPRAAGLWLRMTLTDGDELEGLAANDRSLVEGAGLLLTPPDMRSNTQRIYVPRQAIQALEVVSLIGVTGRRRPEVAGRPEDQPELFPSEPGG